MPFAHSIRASLLVVVLATPLIGAEPGKANGTVTIDGTTSIDPNSRDKDGIPILNWSVMMCMPSVVQALVDRHADLKYQRAPGLTIMQEAGACPAAAKILSAAGAK
jgi:ankyrin repeat protein